MIIAFHAGFSPSFSPVFPLSHMRRHDRRKPLKAASMMPQLADKHIFVRFSFAGSCSAAAAAAAVVPLHGILFGIPLPF